MPMNWNAENDRLLLLKLIETHGISVDSAKIAAAWPKDAPVRPTVRAITERFVKLRKMTGINATIQTTTPSKSRAPRAFKYTPGSTAKKRNAKNDSESDAENDMTEEETPSKKPARRGGGKGTATGKNALGTDCLTNAVTTEYNENSFEGVQNFSQLSARASKLRAATNGGNSFNSDLTFPRYNDAFGFDGEAHCINDGLNAFAVSAANGLAFTEDGFNINTTFIDMGTGANIGASAPNQAATPTRRLNFVKDNSASTPVAADKSVRPEPRSRSSRKASQQASAGMSVWIQQQKEQNKEDGEKSSGEDSAASEFVESDVEYV